MNTESLHTPVTAAKEIKRKLQAQFPGVKFSVRSEYFSGGNSIDVRWNMGPTVKQVEAIADKYQYGWFDGMTDSYNYEPTLVLTEGNEIKRLGGAKYVSCSRDYNDAAYYAIPEKDWKAKSALWNEEKTFFQRVMKEVCGAFGVEYQGQYTLISKEGRGGHDDVQSITHRLLGRTDFTGKEYVGIKKLENITCGSCWSEFVEVVTN